MRARLSLFVALLLGVATPSYGQISNLVVAQGPANCVGSGTCTTIIRGVQRIVYPAGCTLTGGNNEADATCAGTGVSSVTASAPIVSSGGLTPNLSCPTCVTSATLQIAYNNSGGAVPSILLTAANKGVTIRDAAASIAQSLFSVQNNGNTVKFFDINTLTTATTGITLTTPLTDAAGRNGFVIASQNLINAVGGGNVLSVQNPTGTEILNLQDFGAGSGAFMNFDSIGGGVQVTQPTVAGTVGGAFSVTGGAGANATAGVVGAAGGTTTVSSGSGGNGSATRRAGDSGNLLLNGAVGNNSAGAGGGAGGGVTMNGGNGADADAAAAGPQQGGGISITGGSGGAASTSFNGALSGQVALVAGQGGAGAVGRAAGNGNSAGVQGGAGGVAGGGTQGNGGNASINGGAGLTAGVVNVGTSNTSAVNIGNGTILTTFDAPPAIGVAGTLMNIGNNSAAPFNIELQNSTVDMFMRVVNGGGGILGVVGAQTLTMRTANVDRFIIAANGSSYTPGADNATTVGLTGTRYSTFFGYTFDFKTGLNYIANATITGTTAAAAVAGFTLTQTGSNGGAATAGGVGGLGGLISITAGAGGADSAAQNAGNGGTWTGQGGAGGAENNAKVVGVGGVATLQGGTGGAGVTTNGVGGAATVQGGTSGAGAGSSAAGGNVNIIGGTATAGAGNANGGDVIITAGAKANSGVQGNVFISAQNNSAGANTSQIVPSSHTGTINQAMEYGTKAFLASTSATVTFSPRFKNTPFCICDEQSNAVPIAVQCSANATTLTLTAATSNSDTFTYFCIGDR